MIPPLTINHPITGKTLKAYFCVYSPKDFDHHVHNDFIAKVCVPGHSYFVTHEWGSSGTHHHANYIYYASSRDTCDEARRLLRIAKIYQRPVFRVKLVNNMANAINYVTKEVSQLKTLTHVCRWSGRIGHLAPSRRRGISEGVREVRARVG